VHSILAVPFFRSGQVLGIWYFERRGNQAPFTFRDVQKIYFFAKVCLPYLENAIQHQAIITKDNEKANERNGNLIGNSKVMQQLHRLVVKVASLDVSVLIQGESGTGKELIARSIHDSGKRSRGPFVALNCSAIPESLIESELFGHSRGAFTGAVAAKAGSVERANGGTLFLDEIGDLSIAAQAKLLRVIQEREIQRLGETAVRKVDVRFVFATHKDLIKMVQSGSYREDLYYRIRGYVLEVPPLRERKEDVPLLANHFIEKYSNAFGKSGVSLSVAAIKRLCDYPWPGNIREMENLIQSILVNSDSEMSIESEALDPFLNSHQLITDSYGISLEEGREQFDREFVRRALQRYRWNKSKTAKELKITRQGLINMIHRLKIEPK
jgi:Nif-specific regulatory protein